MQLPQTGGTCEFNSEQWQRCAGQPAHHFSIRIRFNTQPSDAVIILMIGKTPEADAITLVPAAAPGRYRVRRMTRACQVNSAVRSNSSRNGIAFLRASMSVCSASLLVKLMAPRWVSRRPGWSVGSKRTQPWRHQANGFRTDR